MLNNALRDIRFLFVFKLENTKTRISAKSIVKILGTSWGFGVLGFWGFGVG